MSRKVIALGLILCLCLLTLTGCGGKDFDFDNGVSWNTTYEEIVKKYGELIPVEGWRIEKCYKGNQEYDCKRYRYENYVVCGWIGFYLFFDFNAETNELVRISANQIYDDNKSAKVQTSIYEALVSKYGEPSSTKKDDFEGDKYQFNASWEKGINNTRIDFSFETKDHLTLRYYNTKYTHEDITKEYKMEGI